MVNVRLEQDVMRINLTIKRTNIDQLKSDLILSEYSMHTSTCVEPVCRNCTAVFAQNESRLLASSHLHIEYSTACSIAESKRLKL